MPPAIPPKNFVQIPRWVIYFQAALLGVVATTFFIFGMMVGSVSNSNANQNSDQEYRVNGRVVLSENLAEPGAVILLLPDPPSAISRQNPSTITPTNFEPLENPTIDWIGKQGGTVVRSNINGEFEIYARGGNYVLLVISTNKSPQSHQLTKKQIAALSQYFLPVEKLISKNMFWWQTIQLDSDFDLGPIRCQNPERD
jgi:hypothetical protein